MRDHYRLVEVEDPDGSLHDVELTYRVTPEEPPILYPADLAHPGSRAEVEIIRAECRGQEIAFTAEQAADWAEEIMRDGEHND